MSKKLLSLGLLVCALSQPAIMSAQDLLAEKPVNLLGNAKVWTSNNDQTFQVNLDDLQKITAVPPNTSNVYLFPEDGGGWDNEANRAIGIQGFYIDMGVTHSVSAVATTWEGAAASSFDIYLTNEEPTIDILNTTPTYSASGLGQYISNTAMLPDGSKGRYLVFQPTVPTNWGWGVKIRSISAIEATESVLTSVTINTVFAKLGEPLELNYNPKDQNNLPIENSAITITVSDNATFEDGKLTINSGDKATVTFSMGDESIDKYVYAPEAPAVPTATDIAAPIFTSENPNVTFTVAYNGGAQNLGRFNFNNGEIAQQFADTRCVFFNNQETTGNWTDANINPVEKDYGYLILDIFASESYPGNIVFEGIQKEEGATAQQNNPFTLVAGEWNKILVDVKGVTNISNMSVRFAEGNASDLLLSNIYFTTSSFTTGINDATTTETGCDVYSLQGICIGHNVSSESLNMLPAGLYIINNGKEVKKIAIK